MALRKKVGGKKPPARAVRAAQGGRAAGSPRASSRGAASRQAAMRRTSARERGTIAEGQRAMRQGYKPALPSTTTTKPESSMDIFNRLIMDRKKK